MKRPAHRLLVVTAPCVALARWAARRAPEEEVHDRVYGWSRDYTPILWAIWWVTLVEAAVLSLVIPWPVVHGALLITHAGMLVLLLGMIAAARTRPHLTGPYRIRLRHGTSFDLPVPRKQIVGARRHTRPAERPGTGPEEGHFQLPVAGRTTVSLQLNPPLCVPRQGGTEEPVTHIHLHADDADALVRELGSIERLRTEGNR